MPRLLRLCNAVYWLSLALWLSALVAAGVAAANTFATLGGMPLRLERYAAYPTDEHAMLAAGHVMDGVFFAVDLIQFVAVPLALATLAAQLSVFRLPLRSAPNLVRAACVVVAAALFAYHVAVLAPTMNRELRARWDAAAMGDVDAARAHQRAFNEYHPAADAILKANLAFLVVAIAASAVALSPPVTVPAAPKLEPPKLLGR